MRHWQRLWRVTAVCGLPTIGCIADLKPEVGELHARAADIGGAAGTGNPGGVSGNGNDGSNGSGVPSNASGGGGSGPGPAGHGTGETAGSGGTGNTGGAGGRAEGGDGVGVWQDGGVGMPDPPDPSCAIKDSDPNRGVSFAADVWPTLSGCRCHNPESEDPLGILEVNFTIANYDTLRRGGDRTGHDVIVAGNACDSILLRKLAGNPPFGERMPLDGPYLPPEVRALISDWITEGARDN